MGISEGIFRNFKTSNKVTPAANLAEMCKERGCILIVSEYTEDSQNLKQISKDDLATLRRQQEPFYLDNLALITLLQNWDEEERAHNLLISEYEELVKRKTLLFDEFIKSRRKAEELESKNLILQNKIEKLEELAKRTLLEKLLSFFRAKP